MFTLASSRCSRVPRTDRSPRRAGSAWARRVVVVAYLIVLGACSGVAGGTPPSGGDATTAVSSPFAHIAPLPTRLGGGRFEPSSLSGRPVVLWFWAPWCPICRGEGPSIATVATEFAGKVQFVGVAGQGTIPEMKAFVRQTGTGSLTQVADVAGSVWRTTGSPSSRRSRSSPATGRLRCGWGVSTLGPCGLGSPSWPRVAPPRR